MVIPALDPGTESKVLDLAKASRCRSPLTIPSYPSGLSNYQAWRASCPVTLQHGRFFLPICDLWSYPGRQQPQLFSLLGCAANMFLLAHHLHKFSRSCTRANYVKG